MVKPIMKDIFFLGQKSEKATRADLQVGKDLEETTKELIANLVDEDSELISIYYGEEVSEEEAEKFAGEIEELYPDVDVDIQFGGQPIYYYVLAVE